MTIHEQIIEFVRKFPIPGMTPVENPFVQVIRIETFQDFLLSNLYIGVFYFATYLTVGAILQFTNPIPKTQQRKASTRLQIKYGIISLLSLILFTTTWLWKIDKNLPYYGYWAGRQNEIGLFQLLKQTFIYLFVFDAWFYATHHLLHIKWFMDHVHRHHHQFMEPSAFAQDAVHPFESILQGPMGHFFVTLVYPMNPLLISVLGFLTSIYALLAHDGRALDLNNHMLHHYYRTCNYGLYWGVLDYVFGTRYSKEKYPKRYVPSWEIEAAITDKSKDQ